MEVDVCRGMHVLIKYLQNGDLDLAFIYVLQNV